MRGRLFIYRKLKSLALWEISTDQRTNEREALAGFAVDEDRTVGGLGVAHFVSHNPSVAVGDEWTARAVGQHECSIAGGERGGGAEAEKLIDVAGGGSDRLADEGWVENDGGHGLDSFAG